MPKITQWPQEGVCDICKKKGLVRIVIDKNKACSVCTKCAEGKQADLSINELLKKYGKRIKR